MIFGYDELKEYIEEDFEQFYEMGFNEKQIFLAVLDEYVHGKDFSETENICIHIFLALNYEKIGFNYDEIVDKLKELMNEEAEYKVKVELKDEYTKFVVDLDNIISNK